MEQMLPTRSTPAAPLERPIDTVNSEASLSGVSWSAVIAGGFVTAAFALILLALGAGLGLSSVSFWTNIGASAPTVGSAAIGWLIFMEAVSSSFGGYLAGRLRTKWARIHSDEVYFRDTAHGLLSWCVALIVSAAFMGSAATSMVGSTLASGADAAVSKGTEVGGPNAYFVDSLFRTSETKSSDASAQEARREASAIFTTSLEHRSLIAPDKTYLAQLVAGTTGLTQTESNQRVDDVFAKATHDAEVARKAVAHTLLWAFLAFLIGAFCASLAATIGGKQRDNVVVI